MCLIELALGFSTNRQQSIILRMKNGIGFLRSGICIPLRHSDPLPAAAKEKWFKGLI